MRARRRFTSNMARGSRRWWSRRWCRPGSKWSRHWMTPRAARAASDRRGAADGVGAGHGRGAVGVGWAMGAPRHLRWGMIALLWAAVVLLHLLLPPGHPLRMATGESAALWLILGGFVALGLV